MKRRRPFGFKVQLEMADHVFADSLCLALGLNPDLAVDIETCDSLDTQNQVIVLGTFSKLLCPGLRLAWIMAPAEWVDRMVVAKQSMDLCSPTYTQLMVAEVVKPIAIATILSIYFTLLGVVARIPFLIDSARARIPGVGNNA